VPFANRRRVANVWRSDGYNQAVIGKPLEFLAISDEEARERYSRVSGSLEETEAHVALWRAIREGRLAKVTDEIERLPGENQSLLKNGRSRMPLASRKAGVHFYRKAWISWRV